MTGSMPSPLDQLRARLQRCTQRGDAARALEIAGDSTANTWHARVSIQGRPFIILESGTVAFRYDKPIIRLEVVAGGGFVRLYLGDHQSEPFYKDDVCEDTYPDGCRYSSVGYTVAIITDFTEH